MKPPEDAAELRQIEIVLMLNSDNKYMTNYHFGEI